MVQSKFQVGDVVLRFDNMSSGEWYQHCMRVGKRTEEPQVVSYANGAGLQLEGDTNATFHHTNFKLVNPPAPYCLACSSGIGYPHTCHTDDEQTEPKVTVKPATYTGGSSDYYQVQITSTTTKGRPAYIAECNDIIEALGMNFAEGNAFKAIWRRAAQRTLGLTKAGAKADGLYDAEKVEFFGARLVEQSKNARS
ncbi:hypothetical protein pEpSNUABM09_39 [Erwinia phage pEp_SNUABM_09]|uniref:Uncharacterized protein n=1 Tax=Erwinia phage pEp_SNUABM_09 TaxID=2601644 RepID=A0A5J6DAA2_9CAUD|nr:hypothetical protein pEpSNUABM09_39 [Erwinia phage pEp_SNUABM_09]